MKWRDLFLTTREGRSVEKNAARMKIAIAEVPCYPWFKHVPAKRNDRDSVSVSERADSIKIGDETVSCSEGHVD